MQETQEYLWQEALLETIEDCRLQAFECQARRDWLDQAIVRGQNKMKAANKESRRLAALAGLRLLLEERALCEQRLLVLRHNLAGLGQRHFIQEERE